MSKPIVASNEVHDRLSKISALSHLTIGSLVDRAILKLTRENWETIIAEIKDGNPTPTWDDVFDSCNNHRS